MRQVAFARDAMVYASRSCCLVVLSVLLHMCHGARGKQRRTTATVRRLTNSRWDAFPCGRSLSSRMAMRSSCTKATCRSSESGIVHLDQLPSPVIGTFWPYAAGDGVTLKGVVAAKRTVKSEQTALTIKDLLRANIGAKVHLKLPQDQFVGTIVVHPQSRPVTRMRPGRAATEPAQARGRHASWWSRRPKAIASSRSTRCRK